MTDRNPTARAKNLIEGKDITKALHIIEVVQDNGGRVLCWVQYRRNGNLTKEAGFLWCNPNGASPSRVTRRHQL